MGEKHDPLWTVQEVEFLLNNEMVCPQTKISPREWDLWNSQGFWYSNGSLNHTKIKEITFHWIYFVISVDHRLKRKEKKTNIYINTWSWHFKVVWYAWSTYRSLFLTIISNFVFEPIKLQTFALWLWPDCANKEKDIKKRKNKLKVRLNLLFAPEETVLSYQLPLLLIKLLVKGL